MGDCEDFFLEYWTSPGKRRRKKNPDKNKKCVKHKDNIAMKTDESFQKKKKKKKKKNSKFKEQMEKRMEKKTGKMKKKVSLELDNSFISTKGYLGASDPVAKPEASDPHSFDHMTQDPKKKSKRKKKVAFDLSPGYICVKRPKVVSSSTRENILPEEEAVTEGNSCSQVTKTQHSHAQSHDNDSQCTSDDINSQDLFITQKTFRTFPSQLSSGEASDKAADISPQHRIIEEEVVQPSPGFEIQHSKGSNTHQQDSRFYLHPKKFKEHLLKAKAAQIVLREDEEDIVQQTSKRQMELNTNLTEGKKVRRAVYVKQSVVNPYLDDPTVVKCSMNVTKSFTSSQQSPSCVLKTDRPPPMSTASISTQTENFFTAELSSYLSFCHKRVASVCFGTLEPLDLSIPQRARKDQERSMKMRETEVKVDKEKIRKVLPEDTRGTGLKDPCLRSLCSSEKKDGMLNKDPAVQQLWCGRTTLSPQSESEAKSADTTSSEDNESTCRTGKLDLIQVRAVQMRLNESFFFKTKGDGQSPRSESPLMKLEQSREVKNRKCH